MVVVLLDVAGVACMNIVACLVNPTFVYICIVFTFG